MEQVTEPVGAVAASFIFGALVLKLVDFVKYVKNVDGNGIVTLLIGCSRDRRSAAHPFDGLGRRDQDWLGDPRQAGLRLAARPGPVATSVAAVVHDFKKAVDNTETASTPRLTDDAEKERTERLAKALPR